MKLYGLIAAALALSIGVTGAFAQSSTGKATTSAPTYTNNTNAPLSLDLNGNLRVVSGGAPVGTQDVNLTEVGGTPVTSPLPVDASGSTVPVTGTVTADDQNGTAQSGADGVSNTNNTAGVKDDTGTTRLGWNVFPYLWNGTTWDRAPGSASLGLAVNCTSGCVAGSGVSQGAVTTAAPTYMTGTNQPLSLDTAGNLRVLVGNASIPVTGSVTVSGTVTANQGGTWNIGTLTSITNPVAVTGTFWQATQPVSGTFWQATQPVSIAATVATSNVATSTGGATTFHLIAANSNNSTLVGGASGTRTVYSAEMTNNSSTIAYLKLYDKATAPTCGTDTPVQTLIIPGASTGGAGSNVNFGTSGIAFALGLGICVVTGIADNDNTAVAATTYAINLSYK